MSSHNRNLPGNERRARDAYMTPPGAVKGLLHRLHHNALHGKRVLEPCCGDGSITTTFAHFSLPIVGRDLTTGHDFLKPVDEPTWDLIITNPPFYLAQPMAVRAFKSARTVIFLQRVNWLGSATRYNFWRTYPLSHMYVLTPRPSFTGRGTDSTEYAWFIWTAEIQSNFAPLFRDPPGIHHINWEADRTWKP